MAELDMTNSNRQCPSGLIQRIDSNTCTCVSSSSPAGCFPDIVLTLAIQVCMEVLPMLLPAKLTTSVHITWMVSALLTESIFGHCMITDGNGTSQPPVIAEGYYLRATASWQQCL